MLEHPKMTYLPARVRLVAALFLVLVAGAALAPTALADSAAAESSGASVAPQLSVGGAVSVPFGATADILAYSPGVQLVVGTAGPLVGGWRGQVAFEVYQLRFSENYDAMKAALHSSGWRVSALPGFARDIWQSESSTLTAVAGPAATFYSIARADGVYQSYDLGVHVGVTLTERSALDKNGYFFGARLTAGSDRYLDLTGGVTF